MRRRVLVVIGTRPEAIKLAPVIDVLRATRNLEARVCVTGQHREMLEPMLADLAIRPDHNLEVMEPNQDSPDLAARLLPRLCDILRKERPSAVLVQGDTTSSFVAVLAAYYMRVPAGHVEAGLRTGRPYEPFPEEMNRRLISHVAAWHFAPTELARDNLLREGVGADSIRVTGNTAVDALRQALERLRGREIAPPPVLAPHLPARRLVLVTSHRRESFGDPLRSICRALRSIADRNENVVIAYPVHLNPAVQEPVHSVLGDHPRIVLTPPLAYLPFVDLMRRAHLVLTDSGGIQEEAPSLRVPVLVMRDTTERPEGIAAGVAELVGTTCERIVGAAERVLNDAAVHGRMQARNNPYGDGHAAEAIVRCLEGTLA